MIINISTLIKIISDDIRDNEIITNNLIFLLIKILKIISDGNIVANVITNSFLFFFKTISDDICVANTVANNFLKFIIKYFKIYFNHSYKQ